MKPKPKVIVPTGLGINSEAELGFCFQLAGAEVDYMLWDELIADPGILDNYQGGGGAGGFAMGDLPYSGQSLANRIRHSEACEKLREKSNDPDFPWYIVCNSFQVWAKLGLLPVPAGTAKNDSGKHETGSWDLKVNPGCDTVWLKYLKDYDGPIFAPASHSEGRIQVDKEAVADNPNVIAFVHHKGYICDFLASSRGDRFCPNGSDVVKFNGGEGPIGGFGWNNNIAHYLHFARLHHNFQRDDKYQFGAAGGDLEAPYEPTFLMFKAAVDFMKERM